MNGDLFVDRGRSERILSYEVRCETDESASRDIFVTIHVTQEKLILRSSLMLPLGKLGVLQEMPYMLSAVSARKVNSTFAKQFAMRVQALQETLYSQ